MSTTNQKRSNHYRTILLIGLLLVLALSVTSIGAAQDAPQKEGDLTAVPGGVTAAGSHEADGVKAKESPAASAQFATTQAQGRRAEDLRQVSIIVTTDESVSGEELEA